MSSSISTQSSDQQEPVSCFSNPLTITCEDRWQVFHRLQALNIDCRCGGYRPLEVEVKTLTELIQLRSVVQSACLSRAQLVTQLDRCWQLSSVSDKL